MTIEERANEIYCDIDGCVHNIIDASERIGYIKGATDKDPISRVDERNKIIDKTIKFMIELGLFGCEDSVYAERYKKEMMEE